MNSYNQSLQSLVESDHKSSTDSLLAESLQLDIEEVIYKMKILTK